MPRTPLSAFRVIAFTEGVTFLLLLCVAMPLKYAAHLPVYVMVMGTIHGIAFIAYCVLAAVVRARHGWGAGRSVLALVAAILPFGPFVFDRSLRREAAAHAAPAVPRAEGVPVA